MPNELSEALLVSDVRQRNTCELGVLKLVGQHQFDEEGDALVPGYHLIAYLQQSEFCQC